MGERRVISIDLRTLDVREDVYVTPAGTSLQERMAGCFADAREHVGGSPIIEAWGALRCDRCGRSVPVDPYGPQLPAGWRDDAGEDVCERCV